MSKITEQIILELIIKDAKAQASLKKMKRGLKDIERARKKSNSAPFNPFGGSGGSEVLKSTDKALAKFNRVGIDVGKSFSKADNEAKALADGFKKFEQGIGQSLTNVDNDAKGTSTALKLLGAAVVIRGIQNLASAGLNVSLQFEKTERSLKATLGTTQAAQSEMKFLSNTATELGVDFLATAEGFSKFVAATKGTGISLDQTREIFLGITEASAALGLSTDDTAGAMRAVQQMAAKGRVSLEELTGQLGERLPGALQAAARAMGVSQKELIKMVESGEVLAEDLLPKLGAALREDFGDAAREAAGTSAQAQVAQIANNWNNFLNKVGKALSRFLPLVNSLVKAMDNVATYTGEVAEGFNLWMDEMIGLEDKYSKPLTDAEKKALKLAAAQKLAAKEAKELGEQLKMDKLNNTALDMLLGDSEMANTMSFVKAELGLTEQGMRKVEGAIKDALEKGQKLGYILNNIEQFFKDGMGAEGDTVAGNAFGNLFKLTGLLNEIPGALDKVGDALNKNLNDPFEEIMKKGEDFKQNLSIAKQLNLTKKEFEFLEQAIDKARKANLTTEQIGEKIQELRNDQILGRGGKKDEFIGSTASNNIQSGTAGATKFLQELALSSRQADAAERAAESLDDIVDIIREDGLINVKGL
jgi:tape measure domain-containing protein